MSKHRRTGRYRKISVAAIAVTVLGVPTAALACMDRPTTADDRSHSWQNRSYDDRDRSWQNRSSNDRERSWRSRHSEDRVARLQVDLAARGGEDPHAHRSP
ncbi:hypothetical protein L7D48_16345, partial [Streptomyces sp. S1A]|nr:hypothetical protein [Streptomyces sp. ICN903]